MPDYQKGKIYRIDCLTTKKCYVGSTAQETLAQRLSSHTSNYRRWLKGKGDYVSSSEIFKNNNYEIILIEPFPCNSRDELHAREKYWTNEIECVNIMRNQGLVAELGGNQAYKKHYTEKHPEYHKQYYETNKEQLMEKQKQYYEENKNEKLIYQKQYYEENKDKIVKYKKQHYEKNKTTIAEYQKHYQKQKYTCECGSCLSISDKSRHIQTKKHQKYLLSIQNNNTIQPIEISV